MFRPMRRKKRELSDDLAKKLLHVERRGVLAVNGDEGYPYAVPINYVYDEDAQRIYFHGARAGHKFDALTACNKVCFTVYGNESIRKETWAPFVQSVVVFGRCHMVEERTRSMALLRLLARKYFPDEQLIDAEMMRSGEAAQVYEIEIEHLSGKEVQEK